MKMRCGVLSLLCVLAIANVSMAQVLISVANGTWGTASTWDVVAVPAGGDIPVVMNGKTVTVDAGTAGQSTTYVQGAGNLIVASTGYLNSDALYAGWGGNGTITVNGGSIYNGGNNYYGIGLGWYAGSDGTLNLNSGMITTYKLNLGNQGKGIVNLYGGTLKTLRNLDDQVFFGTAGSYIDMRGDGTLILTGDRKGYVESLRDDGKIFAGEAGKSIAVSYADGLTTAVVVPEPATLALLVGGLGMLFRNRK